MNVVAIVQARMTSTRLPGKVLADLGGRPVLARVVERVQRSSMVDDVVIATTTNTSDDPIASLANELSTRWFRGDEHDVLGRYVEASREATADVVVRVTADCPLWDPGVADQMCHELIDGAPDRDYVTNAVERTFPRGLDTEVLFVDVLERLHRFATTPADREHVTAGMYSTFRTLFTGVHWRAERDDSDLRLTVDYPEDLVVIRQVYEALGLATRIAPYTELVEWCREHPTVMARNRDLETWSPSVSRYKAGNG